jgi:hypothetical protein
MCNRNGRAILFRYWLVSSLLVLLFTTSASELYAQNSAPSWAQSGQQVIISHRTIQHIQDRHWPDSPAQGAGKYAPGITVRSLRDMINEAVANGRARENTNGRPGRIYEYDFGHPIGTTINGEPATRLRVVVNPRNQVVTAFPI